MASRATSLTAFYERHPVWREHRHAANATMVDIDDVLLLRPVPGSSFAELAAARPPVGATSPPTSLVQVTINYLSTPADETDVDLYERLVRPLLQAVGGTPVACLETEPAENNYPRLPVRTGEHVLVWLTRFPSPGTGTPTRHDELQLPPALTERLARDSVYLRLAPTPRSLLR